MKYKMVCIDMDGTLLNSKKQISDEAKKVLKLADKNGVHIVITTGRVYRNAAYYSNVIGVKSAVIAGNGAYIKDESLNKIIKKSPLSFKQCIEIYNICEEFKVIPQFYTTSHIFIYSRIYWFFSYWLLGRNKPNDYSVSFKNIRSARQWRKIFKENDREIIKALLINLNENKLSKIQMVLKERMNLEVHKSSKYSLEINALGVDKGSGVKTLAEYYGIKREEIICIGDNENDTSMIKYAGLGVAMGNASDSLKKNADYITDTNDKDGVAKVIRKFIKM